MAKTEHYDVDPNPECKHSWRGLGVTAICDPPIAHAACPKCRTFRHRRDSMGNKKTAGRFYIPPKTWYTKEWEHGPWSWSDLVADDEPPPPREHWLMRLALALSVLVGGG